MTKNEKVNKRIESSATGGPGRNFLKENEESDKNHFLSNLNFPIEIDFDPETSSPVEELRAMAVLFQDIRGFMGIVNETDPVPCLYGLGQIIQDIDNAGGIGGYAY